LAEDKRQKTGNKTDKFEDEFLRGLAELEKYMAETIAEMKKEEKGAKT